MDEVETATGFPTVNTLVEVVEDEVVAGFWTPLAGHFARLASA